MGRESETNVRYHVLFKYLYNIYFFSLPLKHVDCSALMVTVHHPYIVLRPPATTPAMTRRHDRHVIVIIINVMTPQTFSMYSARVAG